MTVFIVCVSLIYRSYGILRRLLTIRLIFNSSASEGKLLTQLRYRAGMKLGIFFFLCMWDTHVCVSKSDVIVVVIAAADIAVTFFKIWLIWPLGRSIDRSDETPFTHSRELCLVNNVELKNKTPQQVYRWRWWKKTGLRLKYAMQQYST